MSDPWKALVLELDRWAAAGERADFWWRDDDAAGPSAALDQLLSLAGPSPLALAVIPASLAPGLAERLEGAGAPVAVLQHGYAHKDNRRGPGKKIELTATRPAAELEGELRAGRARLEAQLGARFLPVMVPPWNRIDVEVTARLPVLGYRAVSTYGARPTRSPVAGLVQVNFHVDILRWSAPRGFLGADAALALAVDHLQARRQGTADRDEPTGILSHHLVHDAAAWAFLTDLLALLLEHPGSGIRDSAELFAAGAS